jgi:nucleotide-binding universal stress UspA family protein
MENSHPSHPETTSQAASPEVIYPKILVALDRSKMQPKVFEQTLSLAEHNHSQLMIFYCLQEQIAVKHHQLIGSGVDLYGGMYAQELLYQSEQLAQEMIEETLMWLHSLYVEATDRGISTEFNYHIGEPGKRICRYAQTWGADLIVIGRRGRKGLTEFLLGSVSNYVVHHAQCSVLVVQ